MARFSAAAFTIILLIVIGPVPLYAANVYQAPDEFIEEVFAGVTPETKRLWINKDLKKKIREVMGHDLTRLRIRYWQSGSRTAWILDEIGKTEPITMGFVINSGAIELTRVLVFRESRGWEIRYPFFTDQFNNASLGPGMELSAHIDGISGATLSVNAASKMARLALLLHQHSDAAVED